MSVCVRCGAVFSCATVDAGGSRPCWCAALPVASPEALEFLRGGKDKPADSCFCPACLRAATDAFPAKSPQQN